MSDPLKIKFISSDIDEFKGLVAPEPAVKHVPEWYKALPRFDKSNDEETLNPSNYAGIDGANQATKRCLPFFDAMTAGYYYLLEDDLYVNMDEDGKPSLTWANDRLLLVDSRPVIETPVPDGCHPIHYGWRMNWYYETPPGYSTMIMHPMNRYDLPFYIQSGIVESDIWGLAGFIPFFLKTGFIGKIPKGTPLFQMIPFKRDDWESEVIYDAAELEKQEFISENRRSYIFGYYKKFAWRKKKYGTK